MFFSPFVISGISNEIVPVDIVEAEQKDLNTAKKEAGWQTDWTSDYLQNPEIHKYAMKSKTGELIALGAYQVVGDKTYAYVVYLESAPQSNPTITARKKYSGIGKALFAFGIKFSIDHGCRGVLVFEAKTDELAEHYKEELCALPIPAIHSGGPKRFMIADENAWNLFSCYLTEEENEWNK